MRVQVNAKDLVPGDLIWFSGDRKPSEVTQVLVQEGAEKLVVVHSAVSMWYLRYDSGQVFKYVPDEVVEQEVEEQVFLDPEGNPT